MSDTLDAPVPRRELVPPPSDEYVKAHPDALKPPAGIWRNAATWDMASIPRRPWIAPGYTMRGAVTAIFGAPSAMKSSTALNWSIATVLGVEYGHFKPAVSGPVIVYNVEDDDNEQCRRLFASLLQFGKTPDDIADKLHRVGPSTIGTLLARDETGEIHPTEAMEQLRDMVDEVRPVMLIVDPLAELHTCEENDNTAIRAVIAKFREFAQTFEMSVVILHHTRKGAGGAAGDPDSARGASAIIGAIRIGKTLVGMSEDDAKAFGLPTDPEARSNYIRMDDAKSNYAPLLSAEWFEKTAYQLPNGDTVAAAAPWTPPAPKVASDDDLTALMGAIKQGSLSGEPWSPKLSREPRSVRHLLEEHGFRGAVAQKSALTRLEALGVERVKFQKADRNTALGLRLLDLPLADWLDDDGADPCETHANQSPWTTTLN